MKLTSRQIVGEWINQNKNLTYIELELQLPFGTLMECMQEGPQLPEMETLLNIVYHYPDLPSQIWEITKNKGG